MWQPSLWVECGSGSLAAPRCAEPRSVEGLDGVLQECVATFNPLVTKTYTHHTCSESAQVLCERALFTHASGTRGEEFTNVS